MKKITFRRIQRKGRSIRQTIKSIIKSRWLVTILIILFLSIASFGITNNVYVYYLEKNNVNIYQIKNLILQFIKLELKKAIEIGVVHLNIIDGISFEDIRISAEEDFSNNQILFSAHRMDLRLSSIFSKSFSIEKIVFYNARLESEQDFEIKNFSKYLVENNIPSIEFKNLTIILKKENQVIFRTAKPIDLKLTRKKNKFIINGNDGIVFGKLFRQISLSGRWETDSKLIDLKLEIQNFSVQKISGAVQSITLLNAYDGELEGFLHYYSSNQEEKIDGSLDFYSLSGYFLNDFKINSLMLNVKFSYFSDGKEVYFNRKLNNPHFVCDIQYHKKEDGNVLHRISGSLENLEKFDWGYKENQTLQLSGKINFDINLEELAKGNELFQLSGLINFQQFSLKETNSKFSLFIEEGGLRANSSGEILGSLKGKLFSKKFHWKSFGTLKCLKSNQNLTYVIQSNLGSELFLEKYIQTEYEGLSEVILSQIEKSIQEQQEKMYTQNYIIYNPMFKKFIEQANLQFSINVDSFYIAEKGENLGKIYGNLKYSRNNLQFKLSSIQETPLFDFDLKAIIDRRNPYYDLRVKYRNYQWKNLFIEFCGYGIYPNTVNLDLSLQTSGNNFSEMLSGKSFNLEFEINDFEWKLRNPKISSDFFIYKTPKWSTKGGFSGYGFEGYFRNLELFSQTASFKGFGSTKIGGFQFNFWGQNSGAYVNWSVITNKEKKCQFSFN